MRGEDRQQVAMFRYVSPEQRVPQDHPLRVIWVLSDAALQGLSQRFSQLYSRVGRPSDCTGETAARPVAPGALHHP